MKKRSRERMKKRRARFVVGYIGAGNLAFGRDRIRIPGRPKSISIREERNVNSTSPLSLKEAETLLDQMPCADCAIFELVPVKVNR